ncbi:PAS domain-containing protein [Agrobacterium genomosp. 3]|uniref:hybrid sensor histidine kinase/response regulator n=1 Tax=Agrobacterium tomkonis TaxID=1183410 RepID=UPI001CD8C983|nr:PAS domain-containing protein [Agrobacterium tomkonis]MCA1878845.1 PAS domain-containing protein [Agrobacterium tumefaciens]MCA1894073.1 PAS domain-containing protein [Agrobacterium tomkonis]
MSTSDDQNSTITDNLSTAQAAGGIGTFVIDVQTDMIWSTPEFSKLFGLAHIDTRPATDFETVVLADDNQFVSHSGSRKAGDAATEVEYRIRRADTGEVRWIARKGEFERAADGRPLRFIGVARDVTARRTSENNLRKAQQKLALALEATGVGTFDYDLVNDILEWDDRCRDLFGLPPDANVSYETFLTGLHPDDRENIDAAVKAAISVDGNGEYDVAYRTVGVLDGAVRWIAAKGRTFFEAGKAVRFIGTVRDVTKAHQEELIHRETEERYRLASRATNDAIWDWDFSSNYVLWNEALRDAYGHPLDKVEPTGEWWIEHIHPEDRGRIDQSIHAAIDGTEVDWTDEYRFSRKDGSYAPVLDRGYIIRNEQGKPLRMIGAMLDLTQVRNAEVALRESELRYRSLFSSLDEGLCIIEFLDGPEGPLSDYIHVEYNDAYKRHSGVSGIAGKSVREVFPAEADKWVEYYRPVLETGEPRRVEMPFDETDKILSVGAFRVEPPSRRQIAVVCQDITARRKAEQSLQELNETLERRVAERTADRDRMWRLSTDIMLVADFNAKITAVNPAWQSVFGWEEGDLVGRSFMDLIHPDDKEATLAEVAKLSEGATTFSFENRYQTRGGDYRTISWTAVPDDAFIHAVGRDVTEEQQAALALKTTEAALQQAQKMEAIGNLTGGVAHDFNNLLQVVAGNLQLLAKDVVGNGEAERRISNALAGVDRGAKLASQLLAFGRRQALDPRVLNIGRLVHGMDEMLRRTIGEGVEVETIVSGGLWNTLVDPMQIENAILNLAINARDAMDGFGKLTIEVGNAYLDDSYARLHQEVEPGQYVALSVTDTGTGMSPQLIEKVFEPFFSTKPEGKGTGLGLSMVYGFVKQTGGHVKIYSEVGQGTTIRLYLPRSTGQEDLEVVTMDGPVEGGPETILVAEDDEGVRATVVEMLQELGYRVLKAPDASAALTILESGMPIDMLFTDVVMPGPLKSAELARKAKERLPNIAVLFTSGYTENSIVHGGRLDPGVQLLSKPYTREALARKIRHVLNNEKQATLSGQSLATGERTSGSDEASVTKPVMARVLLVEDNALIRMSDADMVTDLDYEVLEAESAEAALLILEEGTIDILVTDLGLPGMSGEGLAHEVRRRWPHIAIVFSTGMNEAPTLENGPKAVLLRKPHGPEEIKAALDAVRLSK